MKPLFMLCEYLTKQRGNSSSVHENSNQFHIGLQVADYTILDDSCDEEI